VAPTTPTLVSASDGGTSWCPEEIELRWTHATDDVDPAGAVEYEVRINDVQAGNASAPSNAKTVHVQWGAGCGT
jgi:hypothetical protein